jgi:hypothetical protein
MNEKAGKLSSFVPFPKEYAEALRSGNLAPAEFLILCYVRILSSPYGIASVSFENVINDILLGKTKNYANKIMLSLKSKKRIYYQDRSGRRGSFDVYLPDIRTPEGKITSIEKYFIGNVIGDSEEPTPRGYKDSQSYAISNQSFRSENGQENKGPFAHTSKEQIRGPYNDKDKDNLNTLGKKLFKGTPVSNFFPRDNEEERTKEIALAIGETYIEPLLKVTRGKGFWYVEKAYDLYKEDVERGKKVVNPPSYVYGIIKKLKKKHGQE